MTRAALVPLDGSRRAEVPDLLVGAVDSRDRASVAVYLRRPGPVPPPGSLTRAQFAATYGASPDDVEVVRNFAASNDLAVGTVDLARRLVEVSGSIEALSRAFGAELTNHRRADGSTYRARSGDLLVPRDAAAVIAGVFGLDLRAQARPGFRPRANATTSYLPPQVAEAYGFPSGLTGQGECVALIELGGGFRTTDLETYFAGLQQTVPAVEAVSVDGGRNTPTTPDGADGEVMLDVEIVGSVAPGATIAVYFAPNTDQGFLDAVSMAVHDASRNPSIVSISWGSAELTWTAQAMDEMEAAFIDAAAMGVTVTVASGDNGSTDGQDDGLQHVDFPASAPHALACGGTTLRLDDGVLGAESAWNDGPGGGATGGGISSHFPLPDYQGSASVPPSANPGAAAGRGVPDVSGDADPDTGYSIRVDGQQLTIGGTSAVAPLWAGLIALLNEGLGRPIGFVHPRLYASEVRAALHDVVTGSNGAYSAAPGWDPCSGLGTPDGARLLAALGAATTGPPTS